MTVELSETPKSNIPQSSSPQKKLAKQKPVDPRKLVEALTPIRETTFEDYEESQLGTKSRQSEQILKMMAVKTDKRPKIEVLQTFFSSIRNS